MKDLELLVTLWPTFPHFERFATDHRISGVRLNSAMIKVDELDNELEVAKSIPDAAPLYFDIKGRQLRVKEVIPNNDHLELVLNHPISVKTPTMVLFKAGADYALLDHVEDEKKLVFDGGPEFNVYPGESLHIRDPSLKVTGPTFLDYEIEKIEKAKKAGFDRYFLSYVQSQKDIDEFREFIGDSELILKIEDKLGLRYVANQYKKQKNTYLMAACGDLYVEVDKPHNMMDALKLIINKDRESYVGSRMLLSLINKEVPEWADLAHLSWMYDIGYRKMMLCDELCLKEELLGAAVNTFEGFRQNYAKDKLAYATPKKKRSWFHGIGIGTVNS
jgi:hypothetical protein